MQILNYPKSALVPIPAGVITLRDDRTKQSWTVRLKTFEIGATPVTQTQYAAITGHHAPSLSFIPDAPVESVSWLDAVRFCNLMSKQSGFAESYVFDADGENASFVEGEGFRLPSEAEWEYACRAGSNAPRYGELDDIAWYCSNSGGQIHPVGQKLANGFGLYDMLGNVWEWCSDQYDPEIYGTYRIFRGGGWADEARGCLASNRRRSHPTFAIDDLGFRLARSIT